MKEDYHQLLKPQIINSVSGLALIARVIVEGYLSGLSRSRRVGQGLEFSQYRGYQPGDDMRLLDWKMLARSGRYYIKQSEIDTHITVKFIMDTSRSMLHEEKGLSKLDYVRVLIASLAFLAQKQGDAIGLYTVNDKELHSLNPRVHKQHFNRFLYQLINASALGKWPRLTDELNKLQARNHKEIIFFISDLYEQDHELSTWIRKLKTVKNEVVVMHIMGNQEMELDYQGPLYFEDLENKKRLKIDVDQIREQYISDLTGAINQTKDQLLRHDISYQLFNMDAPIGDALQVFLRKRSRIL